MADAWLRLAAFACSSCGMAWLALAMPAHWLQVRGSKNRPAYTARTLRVLGAGALALSLALALRADHASIAPILWVMMLTAAALLVAITLAARPAWLSWLIVFVRTSRASA
jgi:hypothetical protein